MVIFDISYREPPLAVQVRERSGGVAVIAMAGEIDVDSAPGVQQAVAAPARTYAAGS
jgi:hypothetical protein